MTDETPADAVVAFFAAMGFDPDSPYSKKILAELAVPKNRVMLLKIAGWRTRQEATAKDLVQDALVEVLDESKFPWVNPKWTFLTHMTFAIKHLWDEKQRPIAVQREVLEDDLAIDESTVSRELLPDAQAYRQQTVDVHRELGRRLMEAIRDEHPLAARIFELGCAGIDEPAEQAAALGCSAEEIYRANELLKAYGKKILEKWELEEKQRMFERRQAARRRAAEGQKAPPVHGATEPEESS